LRDKEDDDKP